MIFEENEENKIVNEEPLTDVNNDISTEGPTYPDSVPQVEEAPKEKQKKKKSKVRTTIEWVLTGIFAAFFVVFAVGQIDGMIHKKDHYGEMVRFGTSSFVVWTDSMEPVYMVNTAIINYLDNEETIVNRFNSSKSELYMLNNDKLYFNGTSWESYPGPTGDVEEGYKYIYYNNSVSHWNNPHLVYYCTTDSSIWPGEQMEKVSDNIYRLAIKSYFDRVIFTNGDYVDISFMHNEMYYPTVFADGTKPMNPLFGEYTEILPTGKIMTHRIVEIKNVNGVNYFITAGINPSSQRFGDKTQYQISTYSKMIGVVKISSPFIGQVFNFISSPWGLLIFLLVPALYLAVTSIIDILKALKDTDEGEVETASNSGVKRVESLDNLSASERERLKKEMLEEMLNNKKKKGDNNE